MIKSIEKILIVKNKMCFINIDYNDCESCSIICGYIGNTYSTAYHCELFDENILHLTRCEKCIMYEKIKILSNI